MKIDKLQWVYSAIEKYVNAQGLECFGYYFFESWLALNQSSLMGDKTISSLGRSVQHAKASYREKGSTVTWYYFEGLEFSISIDFEKVPKAVTRATYRKKIDEVYAAALNEYRVAHNPLTGLLAKDAFGEALELTISQIGGAAVFSEDAQESALPRAIAVLALDIDFFKQVNDTWGHYYGDQVLKTFGRRLEMAALHVSNSGVGSPVAYVGHPSGEEFLVVIAANSSKEQFATWASYFLAAIADSILPTDEEWASLTRGAQTGNGLPPPLQERAVTASIGVTWHTSFSKHSVSATKISSGLLEKADTALYRAKAAGRNQVIFYDEILASCGRILEYDSATGVVAIDIGSNVGVAVGQEFKVFHSTYTGNKKFTVSDGRTTRNLGVYPRVESGRLIVFNSQPEISFACLSPHDSGQSVFESGSHLEAIPAGSIRHLLPNFSRYFSIPDEAAKGDGLQSLQDYLRKSSESDKSPFAIVFRFSREAEYSKKYGTASLNFALARLFKSAQSVFHSARYVEVLDRSSICVVGEEKAYKEGMVVDFSNDLVGDLHELGILVGVFCKADSDSELKKQNLQLSHTHALDFARFAASEFGRGADILIRHFGYRTAHDVIMAHRDSRTYKVGYADYEKLVALGVVAAGLENLAGLISSATGQRQEALKHYETACHMSPDVPIYKSNYCTAAVRLQEYDAALTMMGALSISEIDALESSHTYGFFCYALALARGKLADSTLFDNERFLRVASKASEYKDANSDDVAVIKYAASI